ncbi:glycosyltransferase family 22 protein [Melanomma pulvis-pyrius CBS 109.77]|uniref:Mannosyltransferase n=1 Tax=Melanomma pulvis-pyrius CBS 109.77 TaxID=1314802 RepID=A0A6A6WSJ7_9PLEO|nr:glycosyltransferase family 22 protein [Melanomma pulvis-pyrius CBS 109.77]
MPPKGRPGVPSASAPPSKTASSPQLQPIVAFYIFLAANIVAAAFSPIQDCDEVFNYWEPTHYLNHGHGLQTWEYSPEYAIRSWTYVGMHAVVIWVGRLLPFVGSKVAEFYFLRVVLALLCAVCETRLYSAISRTMNSRVAIYFLMVMIFSPGMYHASPAYLPSSFAMYTTMLGFSAFMDWRGGIKTAQGVFWFAFGSLLGWPFAGALIIPFLVEEVLLASRSGKLYEGVWRILDGIVRSLIVLGIQMFIDSAFFYRKAASVPLNIVIYNVFSGGDKGPNIYGVEPWHFYFRNLALNFNAWFFLALGALPLLLLQHIIRQKVISNQSLLRGIVFVSPFYLWLGIFTLQPHKEERFMYPAYPALALNAATSFHILLANFGSSDPRDLVSMIPPKLKLAIVSIFVLGTLDLGILRTIGTMTAYSAPLTIYSPLQRKGVVKAGDNVCLGKEWYRFPSTYLLPKQVRAKFIKSEFSGLLPGEFSEAKVGFGLFPGAWLLPSGMNDENREDLGKYIDIKHCKFLVDSRFRSVPSTPLEPDYISDIETWETLSCTRFLDSNDTGIVGRLLWIPDWPIIPNRFRRKWGQYCLLRRRDEMQNALVRAILGGEAGIGERDSSVDCTLDLIGQTYPQSTTQVLEPHTRISMNVIACISSDKGVEGMIHNGAMASLLPRFEHKVDEVREWVRHNCNVAGLGSTYRMAHLDGRSLLYGALLGVTLAWVASIITRRMRARKLAVRPGTPDLEKRSPFRAAEREPGVWIPQDFKRPAPPAYPEWSVSSTKPLPYRPFRYGPKYNVTMGLRNMHWDEWIELDSDYMKFHDLKAQRIIERGPKCSRTAPEAFDGACELLEELVDYLPQRYPSLYRKTDVGMDNVVTGESFNIVERPLKEDPMQMAARFVQDDLAIMFEKPDGQYYLLAGAILLAGFWRLEDKLGMSMSEIHTSGDVPQFKEKLEKGMTNFFKRIQPEKPVLRNNYFIQVDDELAWSSSIGSEDSDGIGWFTAEKNKAIQNHFFRSERQSLRRLPRSGGVVFTIRTYFHPITDVCKEPYVPGRLASAVRSWGEDVSRYKGKERYQDVLLEYLDAKHEEQVKGGLDMEREDEVRSYPF